MKRQPRQPPDPSNLAIVFDLGGVLIDWNPRHLYRKLFVDNPQAMEDFLAHVCTPAWNVQMDAGYPWDAAVAELTARFPEQKDLIAAFHLRWEETVNGEIPAAVDIVRELSLAGYRLYALSNWSQEKFALVQSRFALFSYFDRVVISGEVGIAKPDPGIYREFLRLTGLQAAGSLFIDDSPANLAAADELGFQTLLFTSPHQLREDLAAQGILTPSAAAH
jgi:2-haloacid dehalogenase